MSRQLSIELAIKVTEVTPAELVGLLEQLSQIATAQMSMDPSTRRLLARYQPRRQSRIGLTEPEFREALISCRGNVSQMVEKLGISAGAVREWAQRYRLQIGRKFQALPAGETGA